MEAERVRIHFRTQVDNARVLAEIADRFRRNVEALRRSASMFVDTVITSVTDDVLTRPCYIESNLTIGAILARTDITAADARLSVPVLGFEQRQLQLVIETMPPRAVDVGRRRCALGDGCCVYLIRNEDGSAYTGEPLYAFVSPYAILPAADTTPTVETDGLCMLCLERIYITYTSDHGVPAFCCNTGTASAAGQFRADALHGDHYKHVILRVNHLRVRRRAYDSGNGYAVYVDESALLAEGF